MAANGKDEQAPGEGKPVSPPTRRYSVERLIEEAEPLLGVRSFVAAGGLHGVKGELTVADAKSRINKWLATPAA